MKLRNGWMAQFQVAGKMIAHFTLEPINSRGVLLAKEWPLIAVKSWSFVKSDNSSVCDSPPPFYIHFISG